eukprot:2157446-Rhodomonas_salina.1
MSGYLGDGVRCSATFTLKISTTFAGMTLAAFDTEAETSFKNEVAALFSGKTASDVTVTGKTEVAGRRVLLAAGLKVDYEVAGFDSEEELMPAAKLIDDNTLTLKTQLQENPVFRDLTDTETLFPVQCGCPAGQHRPICPTTVETPCSPCPTNTFKSASGPEVCQSCGKCPAGSFRSGCSGVSPGICEQEVEEECTCAATLEVADLALSSSSEEVSCPEDELVVRSKNASLGDKFCTALKLDAGACPDTQAWEYTCEAGEADSAGCVTEFAGVQRLCLARRSDIIIAADVERIIAKDELKYELTAQEYKNMAAILSLSTAWSKFGSTLPTLTVTTVDASNDDKWLCGGEPDQSFIRIGGGSVTHLVIPFIYLGLSTLLTMAGEVKVDMAEALKERDFVRIGIVGIDMASEVIGGSLFVSGLQKSKISTGRRIDHCTLNGNFDGQDFTFGQSCGGLESMRTMGLVLPELCEEVTTLTVLGLVMGVLDLAIGVFIALFYWWKGRNAPKEVHAPEDTEVIDSVEDAKVDVGDKQFDNSGASFGNQPLLPEVQLSGVEQHHRGIDIDLGAGPMTPASLSPPNATGANAIGAPLIPELVYGQAFGNPGSGRRAV